MATKKKTIKKVVKSKKQEGPSDEAIAVMILVGIATLLYLAIMGFNLPSFMKSEEPKIQVYDCYVTRDYKYFQVQAAYYALEEATLEEMKVDGSSSSNYYFLVRDYKSTDRRQRSFEFIKQNYTKIACDRF